MENKKQTAVNWFWEQYQAIDLGDTIDRSKVEELIKQANQIFEEQIIEARIDGDESYSLIGKKRREYAEQYYNETFKK